MNYAKRLGSLSPHTLREMIANMYPGGIVFHQWSQSWLVSS